MVTEPLSAGPDGEPPLDGRPSTRRARRAARVVGETIIVGAEPSEPVIITVENGTAIRQIKTWLIPMSEVVDLIASALREGLPQPPRRRP